MATHIINNDKVHTYFDGERGSYGFESWTAVFDGYDGAPIDYETPSQDPIGYGDTEQEAIDDLLERIEE